MAHRVCRTNGQPYHWLVFFLGPELVGFSGQQKQLEDFVVLVATTLQPSGSTSSDGAHYWLRASKHYFAYLYIASLRLRLLGIPSK